MHIKRITVDAWRGLSCELGDLSPGLNLICGPNESGKSRLVQALRFALFESTSGRAEYKRALETWGATDGKPRVEVEFELAGASWMLEKTFLGTGCNTALRGAGKTLEGEDAEARLADLMGVSPGGRTELKSAERGIWSLLWVEQGESRDAPNHNDVARARIQDQLTAEIGEVAAGELGQRILRAAREHKEQFYSAKTDVERPVLRNERDKVEQARARLEDAEALHRAVAEDADALEAHRRRAADLKERVGRAGQELAEISERHREAAQAAQHLDRCVHQLELAKLELARREQDWNGFAELLTETRRLTAEIGAQEQSLAAAVIARQGAENAQLEASRTVAAADDDLTALSGDLYRLRQRQKTAALRAEQSQVLTRLHEAESLGHRIGEIRTELAELAVVTPADVEGLRAARQAAEAARARLEGASASLEFRAHRDLQVDGASLAAGETLSVLVEDEKHLEIDGIMSLMVRPGGGELARLRDALTDAERELKSRLAALGVSGIAEADRIAQTRRDLEAELKRLRGALERHLPEGRDEIEARLREIDTQLHAAGEDANLAFDPQALDQAEAREREVTSSREALRARRDARAAELGLARDNARDLEIQLQEKRQQLGERNGRLAALPGEATLQTAVTEAKQLWGERVAARDNAEQMFQALGGEQLALQLQQADKAVRQLRDEQSATQEASIRIEGRLESAGDDGRYERVLDLQAELNQASAELQRMEREAGAARRLYQVLNDEYRGARERLTEPVVARIRPYLADLFPGCEVWLDDELQLLGMRGARLEQEDFSALSGGAREQLSLLVRIGLAEVVGADEPWPLVLDDVLVNTDAERIRRVQRLLYQAARNMQILLFTCHGPLFDMLGPDRRIELERRVTA